jgi:hypothetical protein
VPPLEGEQALCAWVRSLLEAADQDPELQATLNQAAQEADRELLSPLFQFRNLGVPSAHHWTTQTNGAGFGTDYLTRAAIAKSNIFVNKPAETTYFYQDLDATGARLNGTSGDYTVTFPAGELPPVNGFWSLTLYNEHHFFHPNDLGRYSLGTKNKKLRLDQDGSLTLHVQQQPPQDDRHDNWLPAPAADFSVYLRAYWPQEPITNRTWTPQPVLATDH